MKKKEIDETLKKISQGDNSAFERLYIETRRGVYAFLFSYFNDKSDCEDAMQTTYLKIKQNIGSYSWGSNGMAWILQIAKNTALNEIRRKSKYENFKSEAIKDEATCSTDYETKNALMTAMKKTLTSDEQQIVVLHVVWGYKHKEIAQITGAPVGTITSKYKRAVEKLKATLKEESL